MNKESDVWNEHGAVRVIPAAQKKCLELFVVYQLFNVNKRQLYFLDWLIDSWLLHRRINPPLPPKPSIYPSWCRVIWRFADIAEQISFDIASVCSSSTNPAIAKMPQRNSFLLGSLAWSFRVISHELFNVARWWCCRWWGRSWRRWWSVMPQFWDTW